MQVFHRLQFEETKIDSSLLNIEILLKSSLTKFWSDITLCVYSVSSRLLFQRYSDLILP